MRYWTHEISPYKVLINAELLKQDGFKKFKHFRQFAFVVFFVVFLSCCIDYDKLGESDPNISDAIDWSGLTRYCVFHVG